MTANRGGFSLIEIMMALSVLSVVLIALGGLMFQVARQTQDSARATYLAAAMQTGTSHIQALPWDSINGASGCTSDSSGLMAYDQCVSVYDINPRMKRVTLVVSPTGALAALPETLVVNRNKGRAPSPFR